MAPMIIVNSSENTIGNGIMVPTIKLMCYLEINFITLSRIIRRNVMLGG